MHVAAHRRTPPLRLPDESRIIVVSLLGLSNVHALSTPHCDFLKAKKHHEVLDGDVDRNPVAQRCFRAAALYYQKHDASAPLLNERQQCLLPRGWFYIDDSKTTRLYYCHAATHRGVWGHKYTAASGRAAERDDAAAAAADADHSPMDDADPIDVGHDNNRDKANSLAKQLYSDRHEKDFARTLSEWQFFHDRQLDEQLWAMPVFGSHLDAAALHTRAPQLARHLASTLPTWELDRLHERLTRLRETLDAQSTHLPKLVYVHCEGGRDRTGEYGRLHDATGHMIDLPSRLQICGRVRAASRRFVGASGYTRTDIHA